MKKALSFLVAVIMVLGMFPVAAFAQEDETYDLWVGGVTVTDANKEDILNNGGRVSFDPESNTLTLSGAVIDSYSEKRYNNSYSSYKEAIFYSGTDALTIEVTGWCFIRGEGLECGIDAEYADLTICGKGTLKIDAEDYAIYANEGDITVRNCTLDLNTSDDEGIYTYGAFEAYGSTMKIKSEDDYGIYADDDSVIAGCVIFIETDEEAIYCDDDLKIIDSEITVGEGADGLDADDYVISGSKITIKKYNSYGLYGDNMTITDCVLNIHTDNDSAIDGDKIYMENCVGYFEITNDYGIEADEDLTIIDSALEIASYYDGIDVEDDAEIRNCSLNIISSNGDGIESDNIEVSGSTINIVANGNKGFNIYEDAEIKNSRIVSKAKYSAFSCDSVTFDGGETILVVTSDTDCIALDANEVTLKNGAVLEMTSPAGALDVEPELYDGALLDYGERRLGARMNVRQEYADGDWYFCDYVKIYPEEKREATKITVPVRTDEDGEEEENPDTGAPVLF